jgi:hypothetical protein
MLAALLALSAFAEPDLSAEVSRQVARQECRVRDREADEVVVCATRDRNRRYQVTDPDAPFDRFGNAHSAASDRARWVEEGDTGIDSCSAIGPAGFTGCLAKSWRKKRQKERGWHF